MPDDLITDSPVAEAALGCGPLLYGWSGSESPPLRQAVLERIRAGGLVPRVDVAKARAAVESAAGLEIGSWSEKGTR